jgi:hypothetical protein
MRWPGQEMIIERSRQPRREAAGKAIIASRTVRYASDTLNAAAHS